MTPLHRAGGAPEARIANGRTVAPASLVASLALLAMLALPACRYTLRPPFRDDFRSIYLATFGNRTFRRDLEFRLTRAVHDELLARTRYDLAPESEADVVLEGEITHVAEAVLAEDRDDRAREERVTTTVVVRLVRRVSGEVLQEWVVTDSAEFVVDLDESLESAFEESFSDLAERIVQGLEDARFRLPGTAPTPPARDPDATPATSDDVATERFRR